MTIRFTPNNGGFQLSDVPFVSYYLFCLIKSSFIMTLRLRYQTFKNKPKHTGISSDIINKRSMGNLAYTILRFLCLVWKRAGPIVKIWAIPMVRFGPKFPLFSPRKPALWAFLFFWLSFSFSRFNNALVKTETFFDVAQGGGNKHQSVADVQQVKRCELRAK